MNKNERAGFWAALEGRHPNAQAQRLSEAQSVQKATAEEALAHESPEGMDESGPMLLDKRQEPSLEGPIEPVVGSGNCRHKAAACSFHCFGCCFQFGGSKLE